MYEKNRKSVLKHLDFMILDLIFAELSYLLAFVFRFKIDGLWQTLGDSGFDSDYRHIIWIIAVLHLAIIFIAEPYSDILRRGGAQEGRKVLVYNLYMLAGLVMFLFAEHSSILYSRIVIFMLPLINFMFMWVGRECYKNILRKHINKAAKQECMLLIAPRNKIDGILERYYAERISTSKFVGIVLIDEEKVGEYGNPALREAVATVEEGAEAYIDSKRKNETFWGIPIVGFHEDIYEYARTHVVDEVMLYSESEAANEIVETFVSMGITVHMCLESLVDFAKVTMNHVNGIPVITTYSNAVYPRQMFMKRCIDILAGLVGSVITIILTIFVAPMIWIADPGPVFFRQKRVGRNGRTFTIWKFRTMCVNADAMKAELLEQNEVKTGGMFKMEKDPRIIGINKRFSVGAFLRDTSIDEFPQFFNILSGSMSLVGTRPPTMDEYEQYQLHHKGRLAIKPGLTGMWQVCGRSKIADFEKVVKLDKYYIDHFSIGFDIKIILRTIKVVLKREGAK